MAWMISAPQTASTETEASAEQRGAADHDREDGVELEPEPGIVGVGAHDVGGCDDAGERSAETAPHVDRDDQRPDADAGKLARARIAAGRLDQESQRRAAHHEAGDNKHERHEHDGRRDAEHGAGAEPGEVRRVKVTIRPSVMSWATPRPATIRMSVATIGCMRSTATRKPFQAPQISPAPSAADTATGQAIAVGEARRDRARDRDDRADGEIDAAGGDHQHHAEREQRHRRAAVEDIDQAAEQPAVLQAQIEELRRDRRGRSRGWLSARGSGRGRGAAGEAACQAPSGAWSAAIAETIAGTLIAPSCKVPTWARSRSTTTRSE